MQLLYNEPQYYHALYNKICDMPLGESPELKHKNEEEKNKFDNHIKHWISHEEFSVFGFYVEFSNDYSKLIKKQLYHNVILT